ncbi:MAG: tetratricopeptide repeat protein [PVC group bacterium]
MFKRNIVIISFCCCATVIFGWESYGNENAESLYDQAKSLYREKAYDKSIVVSREIIERYPDSEVSVKSGAAIVDCYYKMKDYNLSIEYGNKFLKDHSDHPFAENVELIVARSLLSEKQYDEAGSKYKEFIDKHKGSNKLDEAYYFLGHCYAGPANQSRNKRKLLNQALNCYNMVVNDYPDSVWVHSANHNIGMTYYRLGDYEQAIVYLKKYINNGKSGKLLGSTLFYLGDCYERLGKIDEAKKLYNRIITEMPNTKWEGHAKKALGKI